VFETALVLYRQGNFQHAATLFQDCLNHHSGDKIAESYWIRCKQKLLD